MSSSYTVKALKKSITNRLSRSPNSQKYYISECAEHMKTHKTTANWIDVLKILKFVSDPRDIDLQKSQLLLATLRKEKEIIVKIGDNDKITEEFEMGNKLKSIKGFIKYICYFECNDNYRRYFDKSKIPNQLCDGPGTQMKIIIMPYYRLGSIADYKWTHDNINILQSVIKSAVLTIIYAYNKKGIVHGDFHAGNVVLKETKQKTISFDGITVQLFGMRTWIMDFENTYISDKTNLKHLADFYYDLKKFFTLLQTHIKNIDKLSISKIEFFINKHSLNQNKLSQIDCEELCKLIDTNVFISQH